MAAKLTDIGIKLRRKVVENHILNAEPLVRRSCEIVEVVMLLVASLG